jgi:hypothetical protein
MLHRRHHVSNRKQHMSDRGHRVTDMEPKAEWDTEEKEQRGPTSAQGQGRGPM